MWVIMIFGPVICLTINEYGDLLEEFADGSMGHQEFAPVGFAGARTASTKTAIGKWEAATRLLLDSVAGSPS